MLFRVKDYKLLSCRVTRTDELNKEIGQLMLEGWEPITPIVTSEHVSSGGGTSGYQTGAVYIIQPMVKYLTSGGSLDTTI